VSLMPNEVQAYRQHLVLDMTPEQYARTMKFGLQQQHTLDIPAGDVMLHLGVLDENSQSKGSTEIPMRVTRLKP